MTQGSEVQVGGMFKIWSSLDPFLRIDLNSTQINEIPVGVSLPLGTQHYRIEHVKRSPNRKPSTLICDKVYKSLPSCRIVSNDLSQVQIQYTWGGGEISIQLIPYNELVTHGVNTHFFYYTSKRSLMQKIFVFKLLRKGISQSICQYLLLINTSTL